MYSASYHLHCTRVLLVHGTMFMHLSVPPITSRYLVSHFTFMQVVAAACQMLVAVNQPLAPLSCAHILDYLWNQLTHQPEVAAKLTAQQAIVTLVTGNHSQGATSPSALHYAASIWCLVQHPQHQQQLLIDGRWAELLEALVQPSIHRVRKALSANSRACSATGSTAAGPNLSGSGLAANVPRLQLQILQDGQGCSSSAQSTLDAAMAMPATASCVGSCFSSGNGSTGQSSRRAFEAVRILHLCLQSCWLLLQQEGSMRQMAAEVPPELTAVYAKGKASWWALELDTPV